MKKIYKIYFGLILAAILSVNTLYSQETRPKEPTPPSQAPATFDVIIKKNGDFIYGLIKEVGNEYIRYQRTDIPDGPIYSVLKSEVYAISYRNQLREVINPLPQFPVVDTTKPKIAEPLKRDTIYILPPPEPKKLEAEKKMPMQYNNGNILFGVGFIRGFSKVENVNDYSSSTTFPILSLAYEVKKNNNLSLGIQLVVGTHKFTRQEYSAYDSASRDIELKENIFTAHLYGKYFIKGFTGALHPYVLGGLGLHSSYIKSEYTLQFINNANQSILVKSGARSVGISALVRAGANYKISDQLQAFMDVGVGPAIIQIGISYKMDQLKKK